MALAHFRRRGPFRPQRLAVDGGAAEPLEPFLADADAVADRRLVLHDHIEEVVAGIDDDRALRLARLEFDDLALPLLVDLLEIGGAEGDAIVGDGAGKIGRRLRIGLGAGKSGRGGGQCAEHHFTS
jgi:hypothetical protein